MELFYDLEKWQGLRDKLTDELTIGFVPTMGNLHAGHASLIKASKKENDLTLVSIFINPTQFNRPDDYNHYPRTLDNDLQLLQEQDVDFCLLPTKEAMYQDNYRYKVTEQTFSLLMEGAHRPGHFDGVLTIVMKLLNLVRPKRAYFGEKDYQQYCLIKDMVSAFFMPTSIILCPTIREEGKLAYSSRNNLLTPKERQLAKRFASIFHQNKSYDEILNQLKENDINVEYFIEHSNRRFIAIYVGNTRLIDNYAMKE